MIAGALEASELALLRARPQRTQLYLAIPEYHVIWSGRVNGTPASNDNTHQIAFDSGGTGGGAALTDVKRNMTLLVGSAAFGEWDIGIARIRQDAAAGNTVFYIGITSDIPFADDQYLTVIDDFSLWPVHPFIDPTTEIVYMDYSIPYTGQNQYGAPVPIMGTHAVVELPPGGTVTVHFDASDSYACIGAPTYSHVWTCAGATVVIPGPSGPADITFNAAGTYLVKLVVTANHGGIPAILKTSTAYRYVIVHDAAHPLNASFSLESCEGDFENGGWSYRVTMNAKASEAYVRDGTLCILVARDWYEGTEQSIGPLDGRENIVCIGWVDGESLRCSNDKSLVSFEVQGPAFWLGVQEGFPTGIDDTTAAPGDWSHIMALDPRKGLFSFLHWRTTSTVVMDCYITADNHRLATTYTPAGSLLEQLRAIAEKINARTVCDRYGRLFCDVDTQFILPALRVPPTFPVVQTLTNRDWRDEITIERRIVAQCGQVDLSGVFYDPLGTSAAIFSLSPGHYPKHHGSKQVKDRIALDDQAEANLLAGLWNGYLNNEFPTVDTPFSSNYRAVDIAPRMFVQMNLAAGDTPRGIVWTDKKLIPRRISLNYDSREALLLTDVTFEAESFPSDAVTGDAPLEPPIPTPDEPPDPPVLCDDPSAINFGLPAPCQYLAPVDLVVVWNGHQIGKSTDFYTAALPAWTNAKTSGLSIAENPNIGDILNVAVADNGSAWCITYKDESVDGLANNGTFYCPDITATTPYWVLLESITDYRAGTPLRADCPRALSVDDANIFYIQSDTIKYGHGQAALPWPGPSIEWLQPGSIPGGTGRLCENVQHSVGRQRGVAGVRGCHSPGAIPGKVVCAYNHDTDSLVLYTTLIGEFIAVSGQYVLSTTTVYGYTDSPNLDDANWWIEYVGPNWRAGIISDGTNVLTVRDVDSVLMNVAAPLATPLSAFGADRWGACSCFGLAGYGEVIWLSHLDTFTGGPPVDRFISLRRTGGTWEDKTGDWVASIGAWTGYAAGLIYPDVTTISIVAPP